MPCFASHPGGSSFSNAHQWPSKSERIFIAWAWGTECLTKQHKMFLVVVLFLMCMTFPSTALLRPRQDRFEMVWLFNCLTCLTHFLDERTVFAKSRVAGTWPDWWPAKDGHTQLLQCLVIASELSLELWSDLFPWHYQDGPQMQQITKLTCGDCGRLPCAKLKIANLGYLARAKSALSTKVTEMPKDWRIAVG